MAKNPLLDFKKFDHVSSTKDHTILKHKDGHTLKIAHKSLGPDFQKQLEAMALASKHSGHVLKKEPKLMADGGKVAEINPKLEQSKKTPPEQENKASAKEDRIKMAEGSPKVPAASDEVPAPAPSAEQPIEPPEPPPLPPDTDQPQAQNQDESYYTKAGKFLAKDVSVPVIKGLMALGHGMHHYMEESAKGAAEGIQGAADEFHKAFPSSSDKSEPTTPPESPPSPGSMDSNADKEVQENQDYTKQMADNKPTDVPPASVPSDGGVPATSPSVLSPGSIPKYQDSTQAAMQQVEKATPQQQYANLTQEEKDNFMKNKMAWENDLVNGHITPKTYSDLFANKDTLGKIGSIFGMLVGGAGSGLARQPNLAFNMIQNELDRDFEGQKQSKTNAQNFLRIMQQDQMNKAETGKLTTENAVNALGLARVHAQDAVLHSLIMERDKFPVDSTQWKAADQGLAMMYPMFQQSASKAGDMVAGAKAYYRMIQGNAMSDDPAQQIRKKQMVGIITPEQGKESLKELGQNENHININRNVLDSFDQVNQMSNTGSFAAAPIQNQARIDAIWNPMMDKLTKDNEGRVTPITIDMMNHLKPNWKDDAQTTATKRNQLIKILTGSLATPTLDAIGIRVNKGEMPGETREVGGKLYRKNPATGGWKPVSQ